MTPCPRRSASTSPICSRIRRLAVRCTSRVPLAGLDGSAARVAADEPVELDLCSSGSRTGSWSGARSRPAGGRSAAAACAELERRRRAPRSTSCSSPTRSRARPTRSRATRSTSSSWCATRPARAAARAALCDDCAGAGPCADDVRPRRRRHQPPTPGGRRCPSSSSESPNQEQEHRWPSPSARPREPRPARRRVGELDARRPPPARLCPQLRRRRSCRTSCAATAAGTAAARSIDVD